jgi:Icc protein
VSSSTFIIQLTDCHLPVDRKQKYRGINPYENLNSMIDRIMAMKPDLLLATGDLSEDGSRASYLALRNDLKPLGIPVLALPGNHDDPGLLAEVFPGSPVENIAVSEHGPWQIVRLNSSLPGRPEGRLSDQTLAELDSFFADNQHRPLLIALHHQPVSIGSPWIDKYRLQEPERFLQLIDQQPNVKVVVWGHIHQVFEASRNGISMLGGPSSAINGLTAAQKFTPDTRGPSYRWLELKADGTTLSGV